MFMSEGFSKVEVRRFQREGGEDRPRADLGQGCQQDAGGVQPFRHGERHQGAREDAGRGQGERMVRHHNQGAQQYRGGRGSCCCREDELSL